MPKGTGAAWREAPPALVARFDQMVPADGRVERRQMFGYPAAFLGGHLCAGLFQEQFFLRLGAPDRAALMAAGVTAFAPMAGWVMQDYGALPEAIIADDGALRGWLAKAITLTAALPPKVGKAPKEGRARA